LTQLWKADATVAIVPLLEEPEAAPIASISQFPEEEAAFKKIFKAMDRKNLLDALKAVE
jgi:hypothetical protein